MEEPLKIPLLTGPATIQASSTTTCLMAFLRYEKATCSRPSLVCSNAGVKGYELTVKDLGFRV
eukprot:8517812-Pyramimonas_sp.AAC.1